MEIGNELRILEESLSIDENIYFDNKTISTIKALYLTNGKDVYLKKDNGTQERIGSLEYWYRIKKFEPKKELSIKKTKVNRLVSKEKCKCSNCGLCSNHKNSTALLNLVVTNRCDLGCWYCFFYSGKSGFVYEPSLDLIERMILSVQKFNGYVPPVQITGGEPTLRKDLIEIVSKLKTLNTPHIQLNTNSVSIGIDFVEDREKAIEKLKKYRDAGLNTIYTSFDGLSLDTNPKNYWEIPFALMAYRYSGMSSIVLVPTILRTNLKDASSIVKFAAKNIDIVRGVNFQPVSFVGGALHEDERSKLRVTQSDIIEELGKIGLKMKDFYPVPSVETLAEIIAKDKNHITFYNNEKCGMATYVFYDRDSKKFIPITHFVDVDGFLEKVNSLSSTYGKFKLLANTSPYIFKNFSLRKGLAKYLNRFIIEDELPSGEKLSNLINSIISKGDYESLGSFHYQTLFIGMMHFMDVYNYDVNRVIRCSIHYASPDEKVIPFCTYNVFPEIYRDEIMKRYSVGNFDKKLEKELIEEEIKSSRRVSKIRNKIKSDEKLLSIVEETYKL